MSVLRIGPAIAIGLGLAACASPASSGPSGGPVVGSADDHCAGDAGLIVQTTDVAACHTELDGGAPAEETPATHYGTAAYDDDCKYYVSYTVGPVRKGENVDLVVTATNLATGEPATGAKVVLETTLGDTHAGPAPESTEGPDGTYTLNAFAFDKSGGWTVRFHFYEDCNDEVPDSPHGHAAFFIDVP